jgi:uncharacterized protein
MSQTSDPNPESHSPPGVPAWSQRGLHVIAKPIGPICNLDCAYCFYRHKESLYPTGEPWRMSEETLAAYIRQYVAAQPPAVEEIDFAFQGGEPTLLGLDFFRRVVELQKELVPPGKRVHNSLQTNGILLDDAWCQFLRANRFLVGLSLDGPPDLHDRYRRDKQAHPTSDRVLQALDRLRRHGVEFNVLACVHRHNADHPLRVYRFLRGHGVEFIQFIPIVERSEGPASGDRAPGELVSPRSVRPDQFGRFLVGVFGEWVMHDVGQVFVRDFDQALAAWLGAGPSLCIYSPTCGRALALEHNGDLYVCDHYVDAAHRLGNIHDAPIGELANSLRQERFGGDKHDALPDCCRRCRYLFACHGACPKDRFARGPDGQPGVSYLCAGYRAFFAHVDPTMQAMAAELQAGRPAAEVMYRLRAGQQRVREEAGASSLPVGRNDLCPCGSGRKFKRCCGRR